MFSEETILDAIKHKDINKIKEIIADPTINLSFRLNMPIQEAAGTGDLEIFQLLYNDPRTDINDYAGAIIVYAASSCNIDLIKFISSKVKIDYTRWFDCIKATYNVDKKNALSILSYFFYDKTFFEFQNELKTRKIESYDKISLKLKTNAIKTF